MPGYEPDPIAEHAAELELSAAVASWRAAEDAARILAREQLARAGVRSDVIAEALSMSRATMYRWVSQSRDSEPADPPAALKRRRRAQPAAARKGQGPAAGRSRVTPTKEAPLTLPGTGASTLEVAPGRSAATPQGPTGRQRGSAATEAQGAQRPKRSRRKPSQA